MLLKISKLSVLLLLLAYSYNSVAQKQGKHDAIYSGIPWYDSKGNVVSAHGANIVKDKGKFYLFGEAHTDTSNAFAGFNCYSSLDLYNWKFESIALPLQSSGKLGPKRVGERPKVMKCHKTGQYLMYMHVDTLGYVNQFIGYATAKTITGPYKFEGPLLFNGKPIKKWDMGTFQDKDGSGYVLIHGAEIYKLSDDYKSVSEQVNKNMTSGFESPTMFRKDSLYYFIGSHLTAWEKNDNYYYTATSLKGPWTNRGLFAPAGTLTWNSQSTFVLPIEGSKDTTYLFMGDRWSFPKQASAATYVWQPLQVDGLSLSIPNYQEAWQINTSTGVASIKSIKDKIIANTDKSLIVYDGKWQPSPESDTLSVISSDFKDASFSVKFKGKRAGVYCLSGPDKGYASIILQNEKGRTVYSSIIDTYCKYPVSTLKFYTPVLPKGNYILRVSVMGERPNWSDKKKTQYGSTGNFIALDKIILKD
ncbi:MAG: family 43 glycosylhydrolase [Sphingobacteriaceae bacterium]|nr:family 43 glycosylhydrolase [Sphingobacteriaceae bacterium]